MKPHCAFAKLAVLIALFAILVSPVSAGHGFPSPALFQPCTAQVMSACCDHTAMPAELDCHHTMSDMGTSQTSHCQSTDCHTCAFPLAMLTDTALITSPAASPQFTEPVSKRYFFHEPLDRPPIDV